jgi:hypothetical protein
MAWNPYDDPVNYALCAGRKTPGLLDVAGAGSPRKWEERQGYGLTGATLVYLGLGLSPFELKIRLYSVEDWNDWHAWKDVVQKPPVNRVPRAIDIIHPLLAEVKIKAIVVLDVSQPEQTGDGEWTITIKCQAYRRPKITLAKPEGAAATKNDPVDEAITNLGNIVKNGGDGDISAALAPIANGLGG